MENKSCCQLSSRYPWSLLTLHDSLYKTKRIQKRERENYTVFFENIYWSLPISQAQGGALFSCDSIKPSPPHLISIFVLSTPALDWKSQEAKICSNSEWLGNPRLYLVRAWVLHQNMQSRWAWARKIGTPLFSRRPLLRSLTYPTRVWAHSWSQALSWLSLIWAMNVLISNPGSCLLRDRK